MVVAVSSSSWVNVVVLSLLVPPCQVTAAFLRSWLTWSCCVCYLH